MIKIRFLVFPLVLIGSSAVADCDGLAGCVLKNAKAAGDAQTRIEILERQISDQQQEIENIKSGLTSARIELVSCAYPYKATWWNAYDKDLSKNCPKNQVIVGASSHHDNGKEDRVRRYMCCSLKVIAN